MIVLLLPVCVGFVVGLLAGGRPTRLDELRLRLPGLVLAGLAVQAGLGHVPAAARFPLVVLTYGLAGTWMVLNVRGRRWPLQLALVLVAAGWALNVAAILPHGGMPVSATALAEVGAGADLDVREGHLYKHVGGYHWLGDAIPVRPLRAVISVGDILLAAGVILLIAAAMRAHPRSAAARCSSRAAFSSSGASSGSQWLTPASSTNR